MADASPTPVCDAGTECGDASPPIESCSVCDDAPMARCAVEGQVAQCSCPPGFFGDGRGPAGCAPTLKGISGNGKVSPEVTDAVRRYGVHVFRLAEQAQLTFEVGPRTEILIDGKQSATGEWTGTPGTSVQVELRFEGAKSNYTIDTSRAEQVGAPKTMLTAPWVVSGSEFGKRLASDGHLLLVAAGGYARDQNGKPFDSNGGQVFVFDATTEPPSLVTTLFSDDPLSTYTFGEAMAVHGDTVAVSDKEYDRDSPHCGAVFIYKRDPSTGFARTHLLRGSGVASPMGGCLLFGESIALTDSLLAVLTRQEELTEEAGRRDGAVYVFTRAGDSYALIETIRGELEHSLGFTVAAWGNRVFVGMSSFDGTVSLLRSFACSDTACSEQEPLTVMGDAHERPLARHEVLLLGQPGTDAPFGVGGAGTVRAATVTSSGLHLGALFESKPPRINEHFGSMYALADHFAVMASFDDITPYRICTYPHGSLEPSAFLELDESFACEDIQGATAAPKSIAHVPGGYALGVPAEAVVEDGVSLSEAGAVFLYR